MGKEFGPRNKESNKSHDRLGYGDYQRVIWQRFAGRVEGGQPVTGGGIVEADRQVIDQMQIIGWKKVNILDDFAGSPGGGGVMITHRRAVGLAANKTIGGAEVDEDGVVGGEWGGGFPEKSEGGGVVIGNW